MIKVQKQQKNNPITVIRAASGNELTNYEKQKLASIEENAQENKIEVISVNGQRATIDPETKIAQISLGSLAFKNTISSNDFDNNELFFIRCDLDESTLIN
jgi:hypothetical protein